MDVCVSELSDGIRPLSHKFENCVKINSRISQSPICTKAELFLVYKKYSISPWD